VPLTVRTGVVVGAVVLVVVVVLGGTVVVGSAAAPWGCTAADGGAVVLGVTTTVGVVRDAVGAGAARSLECAGEPGDPVDVAVAVEEGALVPGGALGVSGESALPPVDFTGIAVPPAEAGGVLGEAGLRAK
jgi:hypothetical protein